MRSGGFGDEIYNDDIERPGAWAGFGSPATWQSLRSAIRSRADWYYGDHAYFGRRQFYRITKNAFQHPGIGRPDFNRLLRFHSHAQPFKKKGRHVLICLQSENYQERFGDPSPTFEQRLIKKIQMYSDRPIKTRTKRSVIPFEDDLRDAWAVVTHSSACAMHALMAGVPAFVAGDTAWASLTLRDPVNIERPLYPSADERYHVAGVLAANQWTLDEIAQGKAWRAINEAVRSMVDAGQGGAPSKVDGGGQSPGA
jgi:hypothetical protein